MKKIVSLVVGVTALIGYVQAQEPLKIPDFIEYAPQDSFQVENTCVFGYDLDGNKEIDATTHHTKKDGFYNLNPFKITMDSDGDGLINLIFWDLNEDGIIESVDRFKGKKDTS